MELTTEILQSPLKFLDGITATYRTENSSSDTPLTFREAVRRGLTSERANDPSTGEQRIEYALLARKIYNSDKCDLTSEEVTLIKKRCSSYWHPEISLAIISIVDAPAVKEQVKAPNKNR